MALYRAADLRLYIIWSWVMTGRLGVVKEQGTCDVSWVLDLGRVRVQSTRMGFTHEGCRVRQQPP